MIDNLDLYDMIFMMKKTVIYMDLYLIYVSNCGGERFQK